MFNKLLYLFCLFFSIYQSAECQTFIDNQWDYNHLLKISVAKNGVYQLTGEQLSNAGWNLPLATSEISAYTNAPHSLQYTLSDFSEHPFHEIPLFFLDGGDGFIHSQDKILWYAHAKDGYQWTFNDIDFWKNDFDSLQYFYFQPTPNKVQIHTINPAVNNAPILQHGYVFQRFEKDSFNLLNSGRDWWGEFFTRVNSTGQTHHFQLNHLPVPNQPLYIRMRTAARSFGSEIFFTTQLSNQTHQFSSQPVNGGAYDLFAQINEETFSITPTESSKQLQIIAQSNSLNAQAWIDHITVQYLVSPQNIEPPFTFSIDDNSPTYSQLPFETLNENWQLWNISDPYQPIHIHLESNLNIPTLPKTIYHLFELNKVAQPLKIERVQTNNLYHSIAVEYFIITSSQYINEVQRIKDFYDQKNISTVVIDINDIYFHFGKHISGIRNFIGYQYQLSGKLKYVLLVGSGSFDPKNHMKLGMDIIPSFQTKNSVDPLASFTTDDYFVSLDSNANFDIGTSLNLKIAIGRLPVKSLTELQNYIDKFYSYHSSASKGAWKQKLLFVADDGDEYIHFDDAEAVSSKVPYSSPYYTNKIYLDAFASTNYNGIKQYPLAVQENIHQLNNGVLLWNYNGHGSYQKLADENLLDFTIVQQLKNQHKLPLVVSATCNFAPFDQIQYSSLGEKMLFQKNSGAIGILSTTRLVYSSSNRKINETFIEELFNENYPIEERTIGWVLLRAKNKLYQTGDINNNAKFVLLGDPALNILLPQSNNFTDSILENDRIVDTLRSTNHYDLKGKHEVFANGNMQLLILNKPNIHYTINPPVKSFSQSNAVIYQKSNQISNGNFEFSFVIPADLQNEYSPARFYYHFSNDQTEMLGYNQSKTVGGKGNGVLDDAGPDIKLYLNDEKFVNGGITNPTPILIAKIKDSTGINLLSSSLGHDILLTIDNRSDWTYSLNKYFETSQEDNKSGVIRFPIPPLESGIHQLKIRAWDVYNQWSEKTLDFQVVEKNELLVKNVLNYPNPFTSQTTFWFEHNRPGEEMKLTISIFTVSGKLVKTIREAIITAGTRSDEVSWNGRDEYGNRLARGVYIYKFHLKGQDKQEFVKFEKLFIL